MKKNTLVIAGIALLFMILCSGITDKTEIEKNKVMRCVITRCNVLNNYYTGKEDYDNTYKKLAEIESQRLFSEDVKHMKEYSETDFDSIKIEKTEIETYKESAIGLISGEITVIYNDGGDFYSVSYFFSAEINNNKLKLTNIEKI